MDLASRCRLCAELCDEIQDNVFNNEFEPFVELVTEYVFINITSDDFLPLNVCEICRSTIKSFDDFALRCKNFQTTLTELFERCKVEEGSNVAIKLEVKNELEITHDVEQLIKTEQSDYPDDDNLDDFCDEDFLPLISTITKRKVHKTRSSTKKKHSKVKEKKTLKKKGSKKHELKVEKEKVVEEKRVTHKGASIYDESLAVQSTFYNFSCHVCNEKYDRFADLQNHTRKSHSEKARVLCNCSKYLKHRKQLVYHLLKHVDSFGVKCPSCPKKFVTDKYLARHMETHNVEYKCSTCSKLLQNSLALKVHERSHIPVELRHTHECDICQTKFLNNAAVLTHKRAVHEKYKPFICDGCGKNFVSNGAMRAHQLIHQKEPTLACPQCPKKFKIKSHLKRHIDYHNGVTFKCPECPALFSTKRTLTSHFLIHRDVYKFVCGYCDKKFKWKTSFQSHINNHTGATPYKCDWCPKTFTDGPNCRIHKKRKHPVELAAFDAKKAKENPKLGRSKNLIIKEIKVKDPSIENAITFPRLPKNDDISESESEGEGEELLRTEANKTTSPIILSPQCDVMFDQTPSSLDSSNHIS